MPSKQPSAFGVGDGSVRFRCWVCGAVEVGGLGPQFGLARLLEKGAEFVERHAACAAPKAAKEGRLPNLRGRGGKRWSAMSLDGRLG